MIPPNVIPAIQCTIKNRLSPSSEAERSPEVIFISSWPSGAFSSECRIRKDFAVIKSLHLITEKGAEAGRTEKCLFCTRIRDNREREYTAVAFLVSDCACGQAVRACLLPHILSVLLLPSAGPQLAGLQPGSLFGGVAKRPFPKPW